MGATMDTASAMMDMVSTTVLDMMDMVSTTVLITASHMLHHTVSITGMDMDSTMMTLALDMVSTTQTLDSMDMDLNTASVMARTMASQATLKLTPMDTQVVMPPMHLVTMTPITTSD